MADYLLPGEPTSPWLDAHADAQPARLTTDERTDVAIVGGGIAGLSTAYELRERGVEVVVCERDRVATGVTGKSTAKLTSQHGFIYDYIRQEFGTDPARQYARCQEDAIDTVDTRRTDLAIDCAFERVSSTLYANDAGRIERELEAATAAGLEATYLTSAPPFERAEAAIRFPDQAWYDPRAYLLGLTESLQTDDGAAVYENTRITDIQPGEPCRIASQGGSVTADRVVLTTGFPILDRAGYFARMHPKRSYVLGLRLDGPHPEGMYYRASANYRSVRTHRDTDGDLLLVGGENHKTGQGGSTTERYRRLLEWARDRFPVDEVVYRWSTQDYKPVDKLPFVGGLGAGVPGVFVATGFRGWGMTNGVAAGDLLVRLLTGEQPPEADLFDPLRFTPTQSIGTLLTENADAASQFTTDWARTLCSPDRGPLAPGEGQVVRDGPRPVACARDRDGTLHTVSAICPHMACLLEWNDAETSWDCPCHGSRFAPDGKLLEGPATDDLPPRR